MTVYPHKTTCSAFGCERYTRRINSPNGIYLCPGHWPTVPKKLRALFGKVYSACERKPSRKNIDRVRRVWRKCVAAADINQFGI